MLFRSHTHNTHSLSHTCSLSLSHTHSPRVSCTQLRGSRALDANLSPIEAQLGGARRAVYVRAGFADVPLAPATNRERFTVFLSGADLTSLPLAGGDARARGSCRRSRRGGGRGCVRAGRYGLVVLFGSPSRRGRGRGRGRGATARHPEIFHDGRRGFRAGQTPSSFDQRSHEGPSELLEEKPPLVALARHPAFQGH